MYFNRNSHYQHNDPNKGKTGRLADTIDVYDLHKPGLLITKFYLLET